MSLKPIEVPLPASVVLDEGAGGLPLLRVNSGLATAEIYLHGAHLAAWSPAGEEPVLWMSQDSRFDQTLPIRGGVPICFPWFGTGRDLRRAPVHGFARLAEWSLASASDLDGVVTLAFRLTDSDVTELPAASTWNHPFEMTYVVTIATELSVTLTVRNTGAADFSFEEALHTYFAVDDIDEVTIEDLDGARYLDRSAGADDAVVTQEGAVTFTAEVDRVYSSATTTTICGAGSGRNIRIAKYASADTVVWNPWSAKAAAMDDFDDDGWRSMVCVEAGNVVADAIHLPPGAAHAMGARYALIHSS
jgi:glucose-6-phosphate 1-epimerase